MSKRFLIIAASILLTCALIVSIVAAYSHGANQYNKGKPALSEFVSQIHTYDLQIYDGTSVTGDSVIDAVKQYHGKCRIDIGTCISVQAADADTSVEASLALLQDCTDEDYRDYLKTLNDRSTDNFYYVNRNAKFKANILCNQNDEVFQLTFKQE